MQEDQNTSPYTADIRIQEVIQAPVFGDYGWLLFPVEEDTTAAIP